MMATMPGGELTSRAATVLHNVESNTSPRDDVCPHAGCMPSQCHIAAVDQQTSLPCRASSPDQPSSSTDVRHDAEFFSVSAASARHHQSDKNFSSGEEISTRDVALRVSSELKRYSIPQAVFAQRILGRSQGTLSDLLRNPKPWSKLKSGRETFRRMWKWLQEPEYQRMAALRAGQLVLLLYILEDIASLVYIYFVAEFWIVCHCTVYKSCICLFAHLFISEQDYVKSEGKIFLKFLQGIHLVFCTKHKLTQSALKWFCLVRPWPFFFPSKWFAPRAFTLEHFCLVALDRSRFQLKTVSER